MSTPAKIRTCAAAAVALACCLAAVIAVASGALGGQFQSIGNRDADLTQAPATSGGNAAAQRELRSALDGVGQYEALAADALLTDQQAGSSVGRAPAASLAYYQQATDLMRTSILASVSSLTNVSASKLDASYADGTSTARTTAGVVIAAGVALIAILVALQLSLSARFRRLVNPALAAATLVAVALAITAATRLAAEAGHLTVAKQDAFDSILALTQARAVSDDGNADESRYLVDPARAAQYQQSFLASDIRAYDGDNGDVRFGGYLGAEFRNITFPGERAAAVRTLLAYQVYERDDRKLRALATTNLAAAVAFDIGTAPGQSDAAFNAYDADLSSVIAINSAAFAEAIQAGQGDTALEPRVPGGGGAAAHRAGAGRRAAPAGRISLSSQPLLRTDRGACR